MKINPMSFGILFFLCNLYISFILSATPEEWSSRTIYQLLTDRFSPTVDTTEQCNNWKSYCGGTYEGIINHLDYIQNMGFDAIWISPIPLNFPTDYHGYAAKDLFELNPHFGSIEDLQQLSDALHSRNMFLMVDVVANHMGIPPGYDFSEITPFNLPEHYHDCTTCPSNCNIADFNNPVQVETCRLDGLSDLNQTVPFVSETLQNWIQQVISNYSVDGLRIDTIPEVSTDFWPLFQSAANIYAVGEVFDSRIEFVANYQNYIDATLSYPLFFTLRDIFQQQQSLTQLHDLVEQYSQNFKNINLLGTFIDNHDNPRFLNAQKDYRLYRNAIVYTLFSSGIPIIYYGTEQGFSGGNDPLCREPLWTTDYNENTQLYTFLQTIISVRKSYNIWEFEQIESQYDNNFYAFYRGTVFVAITNVGSNAAELKRTITNHPYNNGEMLCNIYYPTNDCVTVQNGEFPVDLIHGESKIFVPANSTQFEIYLKQNYNQKLNPLVEIAQRL